MKYRHESKWVACVVAIALTGACRAQTPAPNTESSAGSGSRPAATSDDAAPGDAGAAADAASASPPDAASPMDAATAADAAGPGDAGSASDAGAEPLPKDDAAVGSSKPTSDTVPPTPEPVPVGRGPYFSSGQWHGYFWTAFHGDGSTLSTSNYDKAQFEAPLCMHGVVAAAADYSSNAILGLNLNQASTGETSPQVIAPTREGIRVDVTNKTGAPLRVQVQALDGDTNDRARWCADVSGAGGFIPWARFNTACWDNTGLFYNREPISGAMLLVPGTNTAAITYDVCLQALAEADAAKP